jgi:hypothetical protein
MLAVCALFGRGSSLAAICTLLVSRTVGGGMLHDERCLPLCTYYDSVFLTDCWIDPRRLLG